MQYRGPAVIDGVTHGLALGRAHAFEIPVFKLDSGAARCIGHKPHVDFGCNGDPGVGFPCRVDLPGHDELHAGLPYADVTDDHVRAVLATCVPPPTDKRLDE